MLSLFFMHFLGSIKMVRHFLLILCVYLTLDTIATRQLHNVAKSTSGTCTSSYVPGGKVTIQQSTAPTATLQTTAMQNFFTHSDLGITLGASGTAGEIISKSLF